MKVSAEDVLKYSQPGPRYTSYPTVPAWIEGFQPSEVEAELKKIQSTDSLSIYVHIPFCEKLCHFCACNRIIDKGHQQESEYLDVLKTEIQWAADRIAPFVSVTQMHWGGGTPTFLSAAQISETMEHLGRHFKFSPDAELSIEVNPVVTTDEHIRVLRSHGFWRLSMGVQDFDLRVQDTINRHQTFDQTRDLILNARNEGFESINIDLVYGLPHQNLQSFEQTIMKVLSLRPERLAVYSFAKVPWKQPFQRRFSDQDLPEGLEKVELYLMARELLCANGYEAIGMDHFALPNDELCIAAHERRLHRNFMGYTTQPDAELIGLGVSAISNVKDVYAQNAKTLPSYYDRVRKAQSAVAVGVRMSKDDHMRRWVIHSLMCNFEIQFAEFEKRFDEKFESYFKLELERLKSFEKDEMTSIQSDSLQVVGRGQVLVRNIAMAFDVYLGHPTERRFSNTL